MLYTVWLCKPAKDINSDVIHFTYNFYFIISTRLCTVETVRGQFKNRGKVIHELFCLFYYLRCVLHIHTHKFEYWNNAYLVGSFVIILKNVL